MTSDNLLGDIFEECIPLFPARIAARSGQLHPCFVRSCLQTGLPHGVPVRGKICGSCNW